MTSTIETDNTDDAVNADGSPTVPPTAAKRPHTRTHHGDTFTDPYEWMRDKDSPELKEYVAQQNAYTEAKLSHLEPLRERLFEEFRSRIEETDMSVPTRMDGYWYYARTVAGQQYAIQCRLPIRGSDDWDPPEIDPKQPAGTTPGEQIVLDANQEAKGHDFFAIGGMDISKDGRWMLLGTDTSGDERYDYVIREIATGQDLPEHFDGIASACFTPDARYVFTTHLDDAQRPYQVRRHKVGTPVAEDVTVYTEQDERFWTGCGISFDDRHIVISTGSKTTSEVLMLPTSDPEGDFVPFIERQEGTEYDVSFGTFEAAGPSNEDIPLAIVYHNAHNPNFEIDVIDLRSSEPPYRLGDGQVVAVGSPYGTERGDDALAGASQLPPSTPFDDPRNPTPLRGARGLAIEGIGMHRHYVAMSYRADGLPHLAVMTKAQAAADFLAGRPWSFTELTPPPLDGDWDAAADDADGQARAYADAPASSSGDPSLDPPQLRALGGSAGRLYSIGSGGNPSYDAPRMRYSFTSYTRPGELHEFDPATGDDRLLKRAKVRGGYDPTQYVERRVWVDARDGERVPVSLVYRRDAVAAGPMTDTADGMPMFATGYGAYEISSDPSFSVGRLSMLDRGVLYAVPHIRGGGEMGRAWYEHGRRLEKRHTFEDFVDAVAALQDCGFADRTRTVADGGSAGGLLMGAVANLAPERFAGIEADVPFVDALTTMLDPSLPLTVTEWDEWGDPLHDPDAYEYMRDYSPYENAPMGGADARPTAAGQALREEEGDGDRYAEGATGANPDAKAGRPVPHPGDAADHAMPEPAGGDRALASHAVWRDGEAVTVYPHIFVTTSMHDTRVLVVEPLKWVARLQAAGLDALIRVETDGGHGGGSGRYKQWRELCYENAWCLAQMRATELLHVR